MVYSVEECGGRSVLFYRDVAEVGTDDIPPKSQTEDTCKTMTLTRTGAKPQT